MTAERHHGRIKQCGKPLRSLQLRTSDWLKIWSELGLNRAN